MSAEKEMELRKIAFQIDIFLKLQLFYLETFIPVFGNNNTVIHLHMFVKGARIWSDPDTLRPGEGIQKKSSRGKPK